MRRKFKIMYPEDHPDESKAGKPYIPGEHKMVIMNSSGIFFVYDNEPYYPSIRKLSDIVPKYDVVWKD